MKQIAAAVLIALVVGAIAGRYTLPAKVVVKTETQIVEKEVIKFKERSSKDVRKDKETITVEIKMPDGTVRKETRTIDKTKTDTQTNKELDKTSETVVVQKTENITTNNTQDWNVSLLVSSKPEFEGLMYGNLDYGAHVQRRVLGPFSLGAFGLTNKTFGISLGGTF